MSRILVEVRIADEAEPLVDAVREMVDLANKLGLSVATAISGHPLIISPADDPDQVVAEWEAGDDRRLYE